MLSQRGTVGERHADGYVQTGGLVEELHEFLLEAGLLLLQALGTLAGSEDSDLFAGGAVEGDERRAGEDIHSLGIRTVGILRLERG